MLRSLHMKLVVILVLLIVSVMTVTGTFLINSATSYQIESFRKQMADVFTSEFIDTLNNNSAGDNPSFRIKDILSAYSGALGIDSYRNFYILSGNTGEFIAGSNDALGRGLEKTPNIILALSGEVGDKIGFTEAYMDVAIPIGNDGNSFIVYIKDDKQRIRDLNWMLFTITLQAMIFGLVIAVFLSFFLSKTMTNPIESITKGAALISNGQFSNKLPVYSDDEIGELTKTFNNMAQTLEETIQNVENERDKLNTIFLHMADGVVAFLHDGTILHMNPAAEKMLNISFSPSLKFKDVFNGLDIGYNTSKGLQKNGAAEFEYEKNDMKLKIFFAEFKTSETEKGVMAVIRDITEQSRLDEARREFVANVSHELRTPLTNIKSYTETLALEGEMLPADTRTQFLSVITAESDRMTRIVSDLLTLSKLDYGKLELKKEHFDIKKLLEGVYNAMVLTARNSGCRLDIFTEENLPAIYGDKGRIEQVVVNIVSNAVKYTPEGGRITIRAWKEKNCMISVEDTGIGIPEKDIPRIFERFYRVEKARSRKMGGTGLGLSIAKEIVEKHNGTIKIESRPEHGTTVTVSLPYDENTVLSGDSDE